jgi:hypothetical protein
MNTQHKIYVDTDGRTHGNVITLNTTGWTEEDFDAFDGLNNEQTWAFAWSDTGCTTPAQFAAKLGGAK